MNGLTKNTSSTPINKQKKSVDQKPAEDCNNVMMVTQKFEKTGNWRLTPEKIFIMGKTVKTLSIGI